MESVPAMCIERHLLTVSQSLRAGIIECDVNPDIFSRSHRKRTYRGCGAPAMRIGRNRKQRIGRIVTHNKNSPCKPFFLIYGTEFSLVTISSGTLPRLPSEEEVHMQEPTTRHITANGKTIRIFFIIA